MSDAYVRGLSLPVMRQAFGAFCLGAVPREGAGGRPACVAFEGELDGRCGCRAYPAIDISNRRVKIHLSKAPYWQFVGPPTSPPVTSLSAVSRRDLAERFSSDHPPLMKPCQD
jgi:hypothetical protein